MSIYVFCKGECTIDRLYIIKLNKIEYIILYFMHNAIISNAKCVLFKYFFFDRVSTKCDKSKGHSCSIVSRKRMKSNLSEATRGYATHAIVLSVLLHLALLVYFCSLFFFPFSCLCRET